MLSCNLSSQVFVFFGIKFNLVTTQNGIKPSNIFSSIEPSTKIWSINQYLSISSGYCAIVGFSQVSLDLRYAFAIHRDIIKKLIKYTFVCPSVRYIALYERV